MAKAKKPEVQPTEAPVTESIERFDLEPSTEPPATISDVSDELPESDDASHDEVIDGITLDSSDSFDHLELQREIDRLVAERADLIRKVEWLELENEALRDDLRKKFAESDEASPEPAAPAAPMVAATPAVAKHPAWHCSHPMVPGDNRFDIVHAANEADALDAWKKRRGIRGFSADHKPVVQRHGG